MLVIGCDCFMFVVDRNIVCCWKHFTHTVLVRYVNEFWQFQKFKEFCNLQQLAGLKLFYWSWCLFDLVTNVHVTFIAKNTFLVFYSAAEPCISSSTSCFTALFFEIQHAMKHVQPLYQKICCPPKGLLTFIIASSGLLSQFILLFSFCCLALPLLSYRTSSRCISRTQAL